MMFGRNWYAIFPGITHEQEQGVEEDIGHVLSVRFEEQEPLLEGSVDVRFEALFLVLTQADKMTSHQIFETP